MQKKKKKKELSQPSIYIIYIFKILFLSPLNTENYD